MSDIGSGARAALVADGTVNGLVAGRIYPEAMDQAATMPAIDYSEISSTAFNQLAGRSGLALSRLQFRCYAATRLAAVALRVEGDFTKLNKNFIDFSSIFTRTQLVQMKKNTWKIRTFLLHSKFSPLSGERTKLWRVETKQARPQLHFAPKNIGIH